MTRPAHRYSGWLARLRGPRSTIRTVDVFPPSRTDEGSWVFLTGGFICLCVIYTLAFQLYRPDAAASGTAPGGLPYQVMFRDLPGQQQRVYRAMKEGLGEALRARVASGDWPNVDLLAAADIPPFAADVLDKSGLRWSQRREGPRVEYVGEPSQQDAPTFLIQIQEPEPVGGEQPVPNVVDEEHELLSDGRLLHVTYWKHPPGGVRPGLVRDAALEGWLQIRLSSPFQVVEVQ